MKTSVLGCICFSVDKLNTQLILCFIFYHSRLLRMVIGLLSLNVTDFNEHIIFGEGFTFCENYIQKKSGTSGN